MSRPRRARVRALAKINPTCGCSGNGPTAFTSCDRLPDHFAGRHARDRVHAGAEDLHLSGGRSAIDDNLVVRAARLVMEAMRVTGQIEMRLTKRIPMGAGLGGGSSDAAAVLLALPRWPAAS